MQFLTFIGFTALVAIISYYKTRNTGETSSDGYFLGGRSLTAGVIAGSSVINQPIYRANCWIKWGFLRRVVYLSWFGKL